MDGEAKGPTKGWVPLKISHQDGFIVLRAATASPNFPRKAKEAIKGTRQKWAEIGNGENKREPNPSLTPGSEPGPELRHKEGPPKVN